MGRQSDLVLLVVKRGEGEREGKGREDGGMILCAHRIGGDCMRFYEVDGSGEGK